MVEMTPAEVTTILRQLHDWLRGGTQWAPTMGAESVKTAIEMIERLEAAEKSDAESIAMYRKARDERDALRAKIEAAEKERDNANAASVNIALEAERLQCENDALRAEIDRLQSNLTASASAFAALEAVAAEARRNDAIAMSWISEAKHAIGYEGDMPGFIEALRALKADPWPTIARGMITPAHIAHPCKAPPPQNDLEESIRDRIARFAATDDLAKDAADAVLEIVRPLAERSDRLEAAEKTNREWLRANAPGGWIDNLRIENTALRAKIEQMERQEPVWFIDERGEPKRYHKSKADYCKYGGLDLLYALPGAKGE